MHLMGAHLLGVRPLEDAYFPFSDEAEQPRMLTVVHGTGGVGKTALLASIAATRPGHAVPLLTEQDPRSESARPPVVICDWRLGMDEPGRPHPLRIVTPTAQVLEGDEQEALRKREQAWFERVARQGGFALLSFSATRWFSRQPLVLHAPGRTVARYEVRAPASFDDATHSELGRETKQALAYAALSSSLTPGSRRSQLLGRAMHETVSRVVGLVGFRYCGLDETSFEPVFRGEHSELRPFDFLPTRVRHLVAFAALTVRMLAAAYPQRDPLDAEGVVLIDEVDLHQDPSLMGPLFRVLRDSLPRVQWIVTTSSSLVANSVDTGEVLALRRNPERGRVELYLGREARTH